jgi:putative nucleotidyltransferase with HDIG domain
MDAYQQQRLQGLLHTGVYVVLLASFVLGGALVTAYDAIIPSRTKVALKEGQVAPRDVLAPRSLKYESEVLTQVKRDAAIASVRPVYDPPDPSIASGQLRLARQILDYIENVRYDDFATPEQKRNDLASITDLNLTPAVIDSILSVDDTSWQAIDAQVMRLLERVMSGEIRDDTIQAKRDNLPNLISASYSGTEVTVIKAIVGDLIRPNAFYNDELTRQAQTQAAQNVPVEMRTFARGQVIIRAGEIATAAHIEALDQFGLLQVNQRRTAHLFSGLLAMGLITALLGVYIWRFQPHIAASPSLVILLSILFLIFLAGAHLINPQGTVQRYYYPASALAFLVVTLAGPQLGIMVAIALATLVGLMANDSLEFAILIGFSGALGALSLEHTERLNAYFVSGGVVGATSACVALVFALGADTSPDFFTILTQLIGSMANGLFSAAVALAGLYVVSNVLNIPTSLKIIELLQPNHELLQRLLREAPGTYQHSLQVANLAELGAQQVGANAPLLRVAAMYHDIGKILNPHFFVENQADGVNPHDVLDNPYQSARTIIGHVVEGDRLARRYRLPNRIRDFIVEHHGTTQVVFFYREALKRAESTGKSVDISQFTYPGPRPRSRESAILMLADGCESSVRARRPQNRQDVEETVNYIFDTRLQDQQLDESSLTLSDLRVLRDTFLSALQGIFHPRIAYPGVPGQEPGVLPVETPVEQPSDSENQLPGESQPEVQALPGKTPDQVAPPDTQDQQAVPADTQDQQATPPDAQDQSEPVVS